MLLQIMAIAFGVLSVILFVVTITGAGRNKWITTLLYIFCILAALAMVFVPRFLPAADEAEPVGISEELQSPEPTEAPVSASPEPTESAVPESGASAETDGQTQDAEDDSSADTEDAKDTEKTKDAEKTKDIENAEDTDAAEEAGEPEQTPATAVPAPKDDAPDAEETSAPVKFASKTN